MDLVERRRAIELSLEGYKNDNKTRTETINFRDAMKSLEVVTLNPNIPLLNHNNNRLKAQLQSHPERDLVFDNPDSPGAQNILSELLHQTDKFGELKKQIEEMGQVNPGLITRDGLLINGNTRLVAVRELGLNGFDVALLPEEANPQDWFNIEINLQMLQLAHQDYSLTNRLLLIAECIQRNMNEEQIINQMGWIRKGKQKFRLYADMLNLIEEMRGLKSPPLAYRFFDDKEQMLKDLVEKYHVLSESDLGEAEEMKWSRMLAMLLGANKDQVRAVDEEFLDIRLMKRIEGSGTTAESFLEKHKRNDSDDDLGDLLGEQTTRDIDMRGCVVEVIDTIVDGTGNIDIEKTEDFHELRKAIRLEADEAISEERRSKEIREPLEILADVRIRIERITEDLPTLSEESSFNKGELGYAVKKIQKAVTSLSDEVNRLMSNN